MTVRILVDLSGSAINSILATEEVDIIFLDYDDTQITTAAIPDALTGYAQPVWASNEPVHVDAERVNAVFDGIVWIGTHDMEP